MLNFVDEGDYFTDLWDEELVESCGIENC